MKKCVRLLLKTALLDVVRNLQEIRQVNMENMDLINA